MKEFRLLMIALLCAGACTNPPPGTDGDQSGPGADLSSPSDLAAGRVPRKHRPAAVACPRDRAPGPPVAGERAQCRMDGDCNDASKGSNGRCVPTRIGYVCSYDTCFDDGACGGKVCQCRPEGQTAASSQTHHCLGQGNCRTDADCGAAGFCSPSFGTCGAYLGVIAYYCHTPGDDCIDDEDCSDADGGFGGPGYCMFSPMAGKWLCSYTLCAG